MLQASWKHGMAIKAMLYCPELGPTRYFTKTSSRWALDKSWRVRCIFFDFQRHYGFTYKVLILFNVDVGNKCISQCNGEAAWGIKGLPRGHICHDRHVAEKKSKTEGVLKQVGGGAGHGSRIESRGFICSQCCKCKPPVITQLMLRVIWVKRRA